MIDARPRRRRGARAPVRARAGDRAVGRRHHARLRAGARHPHQPEEPGHRRPRARRGRREHVGRLGVAIIEELQGAGIAACGKHFPGHGDTGVDSHHELPVVEHPPDRLRAVEFVPFRAAIAAGVASIMTAHVLVPGARRGVPGDAVAAHRPAAAPRGARLRRGHLHRRHGDEGDRRAPRRAAGDGARDRGRRATACSSAAATPTCRSATLEAIVHAVEDGTLPLRARRGRAGAAPPDEGAVPRAARQGRPAGPLTGRALREVLGARVPRRDRRRDGAASPDGSARDAYPSRPPPR